LLPGLDGPGPKSFRGGTHRLIAPAETVTRACRFMPVMGITRVANVTGLDRIGIPVVMVCRPNSRSLAVAQGKGLDLDAARASGLMESVENYHAEHIVLPLKLCSYEELRYNDRVVDASQLPRPRRGLFDPNQPLLWIEGHDLLQRDAVWLPYEAVHTNYTLTYRTGTNSFVASSNGLASGNHLLEAISHGICEVVERDAATLWSFQSEHVRGATRVDLATVDDPFCRAVLEKFDRADVAVAAWETTSDIGIPAFRCTIVDRSDSRMDGLYPAGGSGCHPARHIALLRALTEAAQTRLTAISGSRDDAYRRTYERFGDPDLSREQSAVARVEGPARSFAGPGFDGETFEDDVAWELERLRAAGIERVVVVNLTRPEFDLPVVRVVIPGLESLISHQVFQPGQRAWRVVGQKV
jgi:ribosomal protein S12 methylthiotransferase accessory factor